MQNLLDKALTYSQETSIPLPSSRELDMFADLFQSIVMIHESREFNQMNLLKKQAAMLGLVIERFPDTSGKIFTVIREDDSHRKGSGFYVLSDRKIKSRPAVIQTPHALSDSGTERLGMEAFRKAGCSAFFSSSVRRNAGTIGDTSDLYMQEFKDIYPADAAHNEFSFFQTATKVYARLHPDLFVIQFHGYNENIETRNLQFDIILSTARDTLVETNLHSMIKDTFKNELKSCRTGIFGLDIFELGALSNVQGQYINSNTAGLFLHVELSQAFRTKLSQTRKRSRELVNAVREVISRYEKF